MGLTPATWRSFALFLTGLALTAPFQVRAEVELLPLEAFFSGNQYTEVTISPDGECLAFLSLVNGSRNLFTYSIEKKQYKSLTEGGKDAVFDYAWAGNEYLVYQITREDYWGLGLAAVRRDGKKRNRKVLSEPARMVHSMPAYPKHILVVLNPYEEQFPDLHRVGITSRYRTTYFENPGDVDYWLLDPEGQVRLVKVFTRGDGGHGPDVYRYRATVKEPWQEIRLPADTYPLALDYDNSHLYVATGKDRPFTAVYKYDPQSQEFAGLVWKDSQYDVVPGYDLNGAGDFKGLIFSDQFRTLAGIAYERNGPQIQWFLPFYEDLQEMIDQSLPDTQNVFLGRDKSEEHFLIFAYNDRDPGNYYLLDYPTRHLQWLFSKNPAINPEQMAAMKPVQMPSRDGRILHGYLTLPKGKRQNLPLILKPHNGPFMRDKWGFDPEVQFLANRGYAVLQVNYRGSTGYGKEFFMAAFGEIGKNMQNDITDAVRWAISEKIADPQRIAIYGEGFGAYLAMTGLVSTPELFQCAVAVGGIYDWETFLDNDKTPVMERNMPLSRIWFGETGDEHNDYDNKTNNNNNELLKSVSPAHHAARTKNPVLLIPKANNGLPIDPQTRLMAEALQKEGKPHEIYGQSTDPVHPLEKPTPLDHYHRIETFLSENL